MGGAVDPLRGIDAICRTFLYLWVHLAFVVVIALLATLLAWAKRGKVNPDDGWRSWAVAKFTSSFAFGLLGFTLAYLLSLGVDKNGGVNTVFAVIATPLLPLLTGGITFLEGTGPNADAKPRTSMIVFLAAFGVCYQTFYYQISHFWPAQ